jgi:hypothetical protein
MLASYCDRGFVRFDLDDESLLNSVVDEVSGLEFEGRTQDAWRQCPPVRKLALHPTILNVLRQLYGEEPRAFQTLDFRLPTQQLTHTDSVHFSSVEREKMCGVWVALEDVDRENGPLMYYPGLHNRWYLNNLDGFESYHDWECMLQKTLEGIEPEYGIMKKGEVMVWSANLLHGGAPAIDSNRTRWSQATHYYFGDGPFYSPLARKFHGQEWKSVEWIQ